MAGRAKSSESRSKPGTDEASVWGVSWGPLEIPLNLISPTPDLAWCRMHTQSTGSPPGSMNPQIQRLNCGCPSWEEVCPFSEFSDSQGQSSILIFRMEIVPLTQLRWTMERLAPWEAPGTFSWWGHKLGGLNWAPDPSCLPCRPL